MEKHTTGGISTACLYPMDTEEAFQLLLDAGYRVFELFVNAYEETCEPFLKRLKDRAQENGAVFTSLHPYTSPMESMLLFGQYERRTREGMELYKHYLGAAAYLGAPYVVIHGQPAAYKLLTDAAYYERFAQLYQAGGAIGAWPAQENVRDHRSGDVDFIRSMRTYLKDDCAFVLDLKQCRIEGCRIEDMAQAMGERLVHIHLSDSIGEQVCLLPGTGEYDLAPLCGILRANHYGGKIVAEVYRRNIPDIEAVRKCRVFMETIQL